MPAWCCCAGGANFPDAPLADGGKKRYHATVFGFTGGQRSWRIVGTLPEPAGEGVSVDTPRGIECVGGRRPVPQANGSARRAFLMTWDAAAGRVGIAALPDFPYPVKMAAAAARGECVYVAGGWSDRPAESDVWMLDLSASAPAWQPLPRCRSRASSRWRVIQNMPGPRTALFVMGGIGRARGRSADGAGGRVRLRYAGRQGA
jgi:N-acetylneuraminic acid mutarotase